MRTFLLASTVLAFVTLPAMAKTLTPTGNFVIPPVGNNGGFESLPVGADIATLQAVMQRNATFASSESGAYTPITLAPGDLTPGTGGSVTDAQGNVYTLPLLGGAWGDSMGGVLINGKYTDNALGWVDAVRIVHGVAYFENAKGYGWYDNRGWSLGGDPGPGDTGSSTGGSGGAPVTTGGLGSAPSATTTAAAAAPNCPVSAGVPAPAAAAGYTTQTFGLGMQLGQNWFINGNQSGISQQGNSVLITGQGNSNSYNDQIRSYTDGKGTAFGGGGYFEATMSWTGNYSQNGGWPSFWANAMEGQEAPINTGGTHVELDAVEFWAQNSYGTALHDWPNNGGGANTATNNPEVSTGNADLSQPHKYGFLWIPASKTGQGSVHWYFDGKEVGTPNTWSAGGAYSVLDSNHLVIMFGTGPSNPLTVYSMNVWQNGTSSNRLDSAASRSPCATTAGAPPIAETATATQATEPATTATPHHGHHGRRQHQHQHTVRTAAADPVTTGGPGSAPPVPTAPDMATVLQTQAALDAAAEAQSAATQATIAAAELQTPANAALVQQAVTAGQQADSILAGVLAAMQGGK